MWFICLERGAIVPVLSCNHHTAYWDNREIIPWCFFTLPVRSLSPSVWQAVYTSPLFCISAFRLSSEPPFHNLIKKKRKTPSCVRRGSCLSQKTMEACLSFHEREGQKQFWGFFFLFPVRLRGCLWRGSGEKKNPLMWCGGDSAPTARAAYWSRSWLRKLLELCCTVEREECPEFLLNVDWKSQMASR